MIRLSAAVLAAFCFAAPALAGDTTDGAIRLVQADDQPMVITPHPRGEQLPPPDADPGGPASLRAGPGRRGSGSAAWRPSLCATADQRPRHLLGGRNQGCWPPFLRLGIDGACECDRIHLPARRQAERLYSWRGSRRCHYRWGWLRRGGALYQGRRRASPLLARPLCRLRPRRRGSKTMVLVYNLRAPGEIYSAFAGVDGSAYLVGGSASHSWPTATLSCPNPVRPWIAAWR